MTVLRPLLFGYSPSNFHSLREGNQFYVHINMCRTFSPRLETIRLSFYSGHAFESANSSQRVITGLAMYDTFNTRAHGGVTPQPNENINCQSRGSNYGSPVEKTELLSTQPRRLAVADRELKFRCDGRTAETPTNSFV